MELINHNTGSTPERSKTMKVSIENGELVIREPLSTPTRSASGKTMVIASSRGNVKTACEYEGKPVTVGFNAYYKA